MPKLRSGMRAWIWDWIDGKWTVPNRTDLIPGRIVCVSTQCGGYRADLGFDPDCKQTVVPIPDAKIDIDLLAINQADDEQDSEQLSLKDWKTIACHNSEVAKEAECLGQNLGLPQRLKELLELAGFWHDWGKSHLAFQGSMRDLSSNGTTLKRLDRDDLAKGPDWTWQRQFLYRMPDNSERRPGFRHELASALGLFSILRIYAPKHPALLGPWQEVLTQLGQVPELSRKATCPDPLIQKVLDCTAEEFDLLVYLVASHHGKVRVALNAGPKDQEYRDLDGNGFPIRGIREGDELPSVLLTLDSRPLPNVHLTLTPAAIGLSNQTGISWRERSLGLLERFGPCALAYLEAILRCADVRASQLATDDPILLEEAKK